MPNGNQRGSAADRRRRKRALLERDGTGPDGIALCWQCPTIVDFESMFVDRIKPGAEGGKYGYRDLSNNRIHCERCSHRQGGLLAAARRRERLEGTLA